MKAIAFANRLSRDLNVKSVTELKADGRLVLLDAINGALQKLDAIAPFESKTTLGSILLEAPETVSIGVTNGSTAVTVYSFASNQLYRTIRIAGDDIDNQITAAGELLHPYGGTTGTVSAIIYSDGVALAEPYLEVIGEPKIMETLTHLHNHRDSCRRSPKMVSRPRFFHVEPNARNQNSPAPAVIRFDTLPDQQYRLECQFTFAPARVEFADLLAPGADIPIRAEYVEAYLLPVARGILADSDLWANPDTRSKAGKDAETAEARYETVLPRSLSTPSNRIGTPFGW